MLELAPGTVLGGEYRIVRLLGAGGMGAVYVAQQASTSELRALKIMHPSMVQNPRLRERFEQEARVGSRIASDHVVRVIAAGVDAALGVPWIAMELLEGEDLANALRRRGRFGSDEVLAIFRQLCHALAAAHAGGIVHRDIKPENVFLATSRTTDARTNVKVLDFGIAKLLADARATATSNVGTPLWMAPEQTDASAVITPAADVWALGLLAYTMLTGRYYWRSGEHAGGSLQSLFREVLVDPITPASARAAEQGAHELLPPGFDAWFGHSVAREASARFPSAREAYEAFERLLAGVSVTQSATPHVLSAAGAVARSAAPPARSGRGKLVAGAVLGALLLGAGALVVGGVALYAFRDDVFGASGVSAAPAASATVATEPPAAPSAPAAADQVATATSTSSPQAAPAKENATKVLAKAEGPTAAPSATAAGKSGKPFDEAAALAALRKTESAAASACKSHKSADAGSEAYKGTIGLRGSGTVRSFSIQGGGGARECVMNQMRSYATAPFDEDPIKTEILAWSVSVH